MTHDELITRIGALADEAGVLWCYLPDSTRLRGHRGVPDMILAGPRGQIHAEVKTGTALEAGQVTWREMLISAGAACPVWHPVHLWDGTINRAIASIA